MRTSCIRHPEKDSLIIVHRWQLAACDGDGCAAMLLSFIEYWHNWKLVQQTKAKRANKIAEMHGDEPTQDESLYQFHNEEELEEGLLNYYGEKYIRKGLRYLEDLGFITISSNPNPRYHFDKTRYILFHDDRVNDWIEQNYKGLSRSGINGVSTGKNAERYGKDAERCAKNAAPLTEITSEPTPEIKEIKNKEKNSAKTNLELERAPDPSPDPTFKKEEKLTPTEYFQSAAGISNLSLAGDSSMEAGIVRIMESHKVAYSPKEVRGICCEVRINQDLKDPERLNEYLAWRIGSLLQTVDVWSWSYFAKALLSGSSLKEWENARQGASSAPGRIEAIPIQGRGEIVHPEPTAPQEPAKEDWSILVTALPELQALLKPVLDRGRKRGDRVGQVLPRLKKWCREYGY